MLRVHVLHFLLMFATVVAATPSRSEPAPSPPELNQAQVLVFMGEHLHKTHTGETLVYDFSRHASGQPDKKDQVKMTVTGVVDNARRDLSFEFLSGDDRVNFPDAHGYRGNPIAVQFLERDIREMAQNTGTSTARLRNRIRKAFVKPRIQKTLATVGDTQVDATEITVVPFAKDPDIAKIAGYAGKQYQFVYSDQVPGDLVRITTRMSNPDGTSIEEELHFRQATDTRQTQDQRVGGSPR